jgi:hypothetical protein
MASVYAQVMNFKAKYPLTVSWRIAQHCRIVDMHLAPGERVEYAFACQKGPRALDVVTTCVVALTDQRLILAQKRVLFGYFFYSITPDLYNDLQVRMSLLWGNIIIDTVKEEIVLSNISKPALPEIETKITQFMMKEKKKYTKK